MSLVSCLRLKVQLADSSQGTRSLIRQPKCSSNTNSVLGMTSFFSFVLGMTSFFSFAYYLFNILY